LPSTRDIDSGVEPATFKIMLLWAITAVLWMGPAWRSTAFGAAGGTPKVERALIRAGD
jgi:hypothetical protein